MINLILQLCIFSQLSCLGISQLDFRFSIQLSNWLSLFVCNTILYPNNVPRFHVRSHLAWVESYEITFGYTTVHAKIHIYRRVLLTNTTSIPNIQKVKFDWHTDRISTECYSYYQGIDYKRTSCCEFTQNCRRYNATVQICRKFDTNITK